MIDEAPDHRKMRTLARLLRVPLPFAVGIMEMLWNRARRYHPDGGIGDASNIQIADYCEMPVETDADVFVQAITQAGFLDAHPTRRLLIHDWPKHCTYWIHNKLARKHLFFADCTAPNLSRLSRNFRGIAETFYASAQKADLSAQNDTLSAQTAKVSAQTAPLSAHTKNTVCAQKADLSAQNEPIARAGPAPAPAPNYITPIGVCVAAPDRFQEWLEGYRGRKADPDGACRAWLSRVSPDTVQAAFDVRDRYNASDEVHRGIRMEAKKFITQQADGRWQGNWPPAPLAKTDGGNGRNGSSVSPTMQAVEHVRKRKSAAEGMKQLAQERIAKGRPPL